MADKIKVAADELNSRAQWIEDQAGDWPTEAPKASAPDALKSTQTAIENLNAYGESLQQYTDVSKDESLRLAKTLRTVAKAYAEVDKNYQDAIERGTKADEIPAPQPEPELPLPPKAPSPGLVSADGYLSVEQTEEQLNNPGSNASLDEAFAAAVRATFGIKAGAPDPSFANWEGDAADAAFAKFNKFRDWIDDLSDAWESYGGAVLAIRNAHNRAVADHKPIAEAYKALQDTMDDALEGLNPNQADIDALAAQMEAEQEKSRMVRETYAGSADPDMAQVPTPPFGAAAGTGPTTPNGGQPAGGGGGGTGGGGGGAPGGQPPGGMPTGDPAISPASANSAAGKSESAGVGSGSGGGSPSGGGQGQGQGGGGSPSGAGAPSGAGLPDGSSGMPGLEEPSLKPASAGGGGSGGGAGGGGGGMPAAPLGPAVGAETVAPSPSGGRAGAMPAGAAAGGGTGGMGGMGGGMGGMGHGAGGQGGQGKEKRRDPNLAPDEELYTEDRAYTEAIIGLQERRKKEMQARKDSS